MSDQSTDVRKEMKKVDKAKDLMSVSRKANSPRFEGRKMVAEGKLDHFARLKPFMGKPGNIHAGFEKMHGMTVFTSGERAVKKMNKGKKLIKSSGLMNSLKGN